MENGKSERDIASRIAQLKKHEKQTLRDVTLGCILAGAIGTIGVAYWISDCENSIASGKYNTSYCRNKPNGRYVIVEEIEAQYVNGKPQNLNKSTENLVYCLDGKIVSEEEYLRKIGNSTN